MVQIKYIIIFIFTCVFYVICDDDYGIVLPLVEETEVERHSPFDRPLYSTLSQAEKKYQCHVDNVMNEELLLYGTKAWRFPSQDVNLTLRYPSENSQGARDHIITGVTVILNLDGIDRGGFVKEGGILRDHIVLNFIMANTSRLSYQFWLYGISKNINFSSFNERVLC